MIHHKRFISINRVATLIGIGHRTARRMLEGLGLPTVRIGKRELYRTRAVEDRIGDLFAHEAEMAPVGS